MSLEGHPRAVLDALAQTLLSGDAERIVVVGAEPFLEKPIPHWGIVLETGENAFVATTAGISQPPVPIGTSGLTTFELCAVTGGHSPALLCVLSALAREICALADPMFYGTPEQGLRAVESQARGEDVSGRTFAPHDVLTISAGPDGVTGRSFLLWPRWLLEVDGTPVHFVEPLPVSDDEKAKLAGMSREDAAAWVTALGPSTRERWSSFT